MFVPDEGRRFEAVPILVGQRSDPGGCGLAPFGALKVERIRRRFGDPGVPDREGLRRRNVLPARFRRRRRLGFGGRRDFAAGLLFETRRDDRHLDEILHGRVDDAAEDDVRFGVGHFVNEVRGSRNLVEGHVRAAGDVDQDSPGALDRRVDKQRARDGLVGGFDRPVFAGG